jgi:hypothetical protein
MLLLCTVIAVVVVATRVRARSGASSAAAYARMSCETFNYAGNGQGSGDPTSDKGRSDAQEATRLAALAAKRDGRWQGLLGAQIENSATLDRLVAERKLFPDEADNRRAADQMHSAVVLVRTQCDLALAR